MIRICHHNTQGLYNDYLIIKDALGSDKIIHCVYEDHMMYQKTTVNETVQINIFLEHINSNYLDYANYNILVPNLEWFNKNDSAFVNKIDFFWCKTEYCFNTLKLKFKEKAIFIGFTSLNRKRNVAKNHDYIFHLKGISKYKNSQILVDTWSQHPEWPTLVIVHYGIPDSNGVLLLKKPFKPYSNVIVYQWKLEANDLIYLMNVCPVHICPSFSEGFGHYINEARSCGSYIITTNGEPMNEFIENNGLLIDYEKVHNVNLGKGYTITQNAIENCITQFCSLSKDDITKGGNESEFLYKKQHDDFHFSINNAIKMLL